MVRVHGYDMYLSCLNLELVRAGLVKVDYQRWSNYSFTEPAKDGDYVANWQFDLDCARRHHSAGEKPKVSFKWPAQGEPVQH
jgi:hypothetical protein